MARCISSSLLTFLLTVGGGGCISGSGAGMNEAPAGGEGEGQQGEGEGEGAGEGEGQGGRDGGLPDGAVGQHAFGEPCTGNGDCQSAFCVNAGDASLCSRLCAEEDCPVGWSCKGVTNFGSDLTFVCAPLAATLCEPCRQASDCGPLAADLCLQVGNDKRCGRDCADGRACPEFYECQDVALPGGRTAKQCLPTGGRCGCTADEVGTTRPCVVENGFGRCTGIEYCDADQGWINCNAAIPSPEVCDAQDNDCDSMVDEGLDGSPCDITNGFGTCKGTLKCNGITGKECLGQKPELEVCDGIDNDCDGDVDEDLCFDGNPCTQDICDPGGGCTYPSKAGPCDDANGCTTNDHCIEGVCTGSQTNCDDNNSCTDDSCDPASGQCRHTNNSAPCESGNLCTSDVCDGGQCRRGGPINCDDGNPCTDDRCDPATGCQHPTVDNRPCDDDDSCTSLSVCSGGECVATQQYCDSQCSCLIYVCLPIPGFPVCTCYCPQ